jgi:ketosteroid isomerase-like protein
MSEENVEVVRRLFDALARGDFEGATSELDPNAEWHNTAVFPGPKVVRGATAIVDFLRDMFAAYSGSEGTIENIADADDTVVVEIHSRARGARSGIPIDARWANTFRLRHAKVVRVDTHGRYAEALQAAGLRERVRANRRAT